MNLSYLILVAFLVGFLLTARNIYRRGHPIAGVLVSAGAIGFFGCWLVPLAGSTLDYVELPSTGQGLLGPNGRIYTFTMHLSRIQRYDPDGRFEKGWFVDARGGPAALGLTEKTKIIVALHRRDVAIIHTLDGEPIGSPHAFVYKRPGKQRLQMIPTPHGGLPELSYDLGSNDLMYPENYEVAGVSLLPVTNMGRQRGGLLPALLIPFWNPIIPWILFASGFLLYQLTRD